MSEQLNLFDRPSLMITPRLKAAMRAAIKDGPLSRDQVVDRMTEICAMDGIRSVSVSRPMLDKWTAETAPHVIPLTLLPVFCQAVGSLAPLAVMTSAVGALLINKEDAKLLAWARAEVTKRQAAKEAKRRAEEVGL